jgi:hypothetical protein
LPNARFQEASLLLALLFSRKFPGNIYYANSNIRDWIDAAVYFWHKSLNSDGSANEVYPFERSFCATSFSAYCISESLFILNNAGMLNTDKTAKWLVKHDNADVGNQMAAAACALYNFYRITQDAKFLSACDAKLNKLYGMQDSHGFYLEYGGADIGYQTLSISMLSRLHKKKKDGRLFSSLLKAEAALGPLVGEQGDFSYEQTSRRTQFIYPFGLAYLHSDILNRHVKGVSHNHILNPGWMDDRYLIQLSSDYLAAYLEFVQC